MAEMFRSALSYISQTGKAENDFVGQYVELGPVKLRIKKVLAEGGYYSRASVLFVSRFQTVFPFTQVDMGLFLLRKTLHLVKTMP